MAEALIAVTVLVGAALVLAIGGLAVLYGLALRPDRFDVPPVPLDAVDDYLTRRASFAVTVTESTPLSTDEVWRRLTEQPYLSRLPFITGPTWTSDARGMGAHRTMSGTFIGVGQQTIEMIDHAQITLAGTGVSVPWAIADFVERFTLTAGPRDTVQVSWTIAGSPRWVRWLPWRWAAPLTRPVLAYFLQHVLRLGTFRARRHFGAADKTGKSR